MTVNELIHELKKYDGNTSVVLSEYVYGDVNGNTCYYPEKRDIAQLYDIFKDGSITIILE